MRGNSIEVFVAVWGNADGSPLEGGEPTTEEEPADE